MVEKSNVSVRNRVVSLDTVSALVVVIFVELTVNARIARIWSTGRIRREIGRRTKDASVLSLNVLKTIASVSRKVRDVLISVNVLAVAI
jgi:hypothetical protein